ncbi:hypothetical protein H2198_007804 [Neophaeococcomyces mojaviensis]|uniref:Uncharacterized protein n=1 Tax=Neophaeococcomyces mojaviensis TaxID=3383035 RepID=A0ACC2ZZ05_9EURO|nr:hypothetical protein H2198_007804 [Knufia sp. JES_112]
MAPTFVCGGLDTFGVAFQRSRYMPSSPANPHTLPMQTYAVQSRPGYITPTVPAAHELELHLWLAGSNEMGLPSVGIVRRDTTARDGSSQHWHDLDPRGVPFQDKSLISNKISGTPISDHYNMSVSSMDEKKASSIKEINQVDTVGGTTSPSPYTQIFQSEDVNSSQLREKRFLRKVDLHILTFLVPMYLFNILDRSNLAQARLGGLEKDLGMKGTDFNLATSILFVGYLTMQLPSNLILTRIRPSLYLGLVMAVWGAVSACTALVHSFGGLMAVRIILGIAEAPFFSGAIMLMSSWYTRGELAQRISWFYSGNALANMFGGLLAAGVLGNLDGAHGIEGWRWLFIIEGVITIGIALAATLVLPNYPATTKWLSEEEKAFALWRLACDVSEEDDSASTGLLEGLKMSLKDYKLYLFILLQHVSLITQTFQYFFPSIVKTLGYGNIETLLLTAPVWFLTFLVSVFVTYSAKRTGDRSMHIITLTLISAVGNAVATATHSTGARFFAMFLMPLGAVCAYQIIVVWVANTFVRPLVKRSSCIAICNMIGNCANIYGSYMYPSSAAPQYIPGGSANAALCGLVAVLALIIRYVLKHENEKLKTTETEEVVFDGRSGMKKSFRYLV